MVAHVVAVVGPALLARLVTGARRPLHRQRPEQAALVGAVLVAVVVPTAEVEPLLAPPTLERDQRLVVALKSRISDNGAVTSHPQRITAEHLVGRAGLRRTAIAAILVAQPRTVREALRIPDVGRKTTRHLLALGLLTDEEGGQSPR